jgi:hypothetical protein
MAIAFEQRMFPAMFPSIGRKAALVVFCPASNMTPDLVERPVMEVENAIGEPIRHTIRKLFPKKLDRSIAAEVTLAWKAPKRMLMLSNQFSRPTQLTITANRFSRVKGGIYPADYGVFSIEITNAAPRALDPLGRLPTFATLSGAFMARRLPGMERIDGRSHDGARTRAAVTQQGIPVCLRGRLENFGAIRLGHLFWAAMCSCVWPAARARNHREGSRWRCCYMADQDVV